MKTLLEKLAILAGGGNLPQAIAREHATEVFIIAFKGHTDAAFAAHYPHTWVRLAAIGQTIHALKKANVTHVVFAGSIRRPQLHQLLPDWRGLRLLHKANWRLGGDDALLRLLIAELEGEGFTVRGVHELCPGLLAVSGVYTQTQPSPAQQQDIALGMRVAADLGRHDIGQSVIVRHGQVIGVEGVEGTAMLIERCRPWAKGGVLIKRCKPGQDRRVDMPAIGRETVTQAAAVGLAGIAVEAGATLLLEAQAAAQDADREGLFVAGVSA